MDYEPDSNKNKFRASRVAMLSRLVSDVLAEKEECLILDAGGTTGFWDVWKENFDWTRTRVTCVNPDPSHLASESAPGSVKMQVGDACSLPEYPDDSFDVVFSNSVIEHVGAFRDMEKLATEIRRLSPRHLIQTPYYWFPMEPHARTPFIHWIPEPRAISLVMKRRCGFWGRQSNISSATKMVQSARLLTISQMEALFPDSTVHREKFMGMTKSLIAIRNSRVQAEEAQNDQ